MYHDGRCDGLKRKRTRKRGVKPTGTAQLAAVARSCKEVVMTLTTANALLNALSLDHLRGSDQEQLRKFIELCHHWEMLAKEELERRKGSKG